MKQLQRLTPEAKPDHKATAKDFLLLIWFSRIHPVNQASQSQSEENKDQINDLEQVSPASEAHTVSPASEAHTASPASKVDIDAPFLATHEDVSASEQSETSKHIDKRQLKAKDRKRALQRAGVPRLYRYTGLFLIDSSRMIVMGWCFWLLASGMMVWGSKAFPILHTLRQRMIENEANLGQESFTSSLVMSTALYGGGIKWMMLSSCIGWLLLWPALRLSQQYALFEIAVRKTKSTDEILCRHPSRETQLVRKRISPGLILRDWLSMSMIFQAVIWPISYRAGWSMSQAIILDLNVIGWSLLIAGLVAWGVQSRVFEMRNEDGKGDQPSKRTPKQNQLGMSQRTIAMLLCVLLVLGEPIFNVFQAYVSHDAESQRILSGVWPMGAFLRLSDLKFSEAWYAELPETVCLWFACFMIWGFTMLFHPGRSQPPQTLEEGSSER